MKETVLDILIYLFENYFDADIESAPEPDRDTLKDELERAGFSEHEVNRALQWLEQRDNQEIVHEEEPGTGFWRRAAVSALSVLPIEWLL